MLRACGVEEIEKGAQCLALLGALPFSVELSEIVFYVHVPCMFISHSTGRSKYIYKYALAEIN